ncbi:MAG TPA: hypothetical protein VMA77_05190 [Solirubrobacteraceae bacterium]|nr:hypothetical protein [Solirubrobacteraceae bacterium]
MKTSSRRGTTDPPASARGRRRRHERFAVLLLGAAIAAALIAGCGGGSQGTSVGRNNSGASKASVAHTNPRLSTKTGTASLTAPRLLAFAKCMRAHGVPDYPDPKPPGQLPSTHVTSPAPAGGFTANPNSPAYQTASNDCRPLAVAQPVTQSQQDQLTTAQLKFAKCMRAHGVASFPDPTSSGEIGDDGAISGVNPSSPAVQGAQTTCSKFLFHPPGLPGGPPASATGG